MKKPQVLVVDDDTSIQKLVCVSLQLEGYEVHIASSGQEALKLLNENIVEPSLIILDIRMPGMNGIEVCRHIRTFSTVPIIMLTGLTEDEDVVCGIKCGADDYITKPFSIDVLKVRVQALLRRTLWSGQTESPRFRSGDLTVDLLHHKVIRDGKEIILTNAEYQILSLLVVNCGRVVTNSQFLESIWGWDYQEDSHVVKVVISRLRSKIGDNVHNPKYIATRPGIGYIFLKPEESGTALKSCYHEDRNPNFS